MGDIFTKPFTESIYRVYKDNREFSMFSYKLLIFLILIFIGFWNNRLAHMYMPKWTSYKKMDKGLIGNYQDHIKIFMVTLLIYFMANYRTVFDQNSKIILWFIVYLGSLYTAGTLDYLTPISKFFGVDEEGYINFKTMPTNGILVFSSICFVTLIYLFIHIAKIFSGHENLLIFNKMKYSILTILILIASIFPMFIPLIKGQEGFKGIKYWFFFLILLLLMRSSDILNIFLIGLVYGFLIYGMSKYRGNILKE